MALHADLEALLQHMDPADAAVQRTIFEKTPKLAEGFLRQADYDRKMNLSKEEVRKAEEMSDKWKSWADKNVPIHEKLMRDYDAAQSTITTLQAQVTSSASRAVGEHGDDEVNQAQLETAINQRLKTFGSEYVSKADVDKIAREEAAKIVKAEFEGSRKDFLENTFPQTMEIMHSSVELSFEHQGEFGKPLNVEDRRAIAKLMTDRNLATVREAYDEYVKPKRMEKEIADKVKAGVQSEISKLTIPGVTGPASEQGPMQIRLKEADPLAGKSFELGDGTAAAAAAAELRGEGKIFSS